MNYTELVATVKAYSDRYDVEVADNIDLFITMAESRVNRVLKTREQSKRATTPTTGEEYYSLPADYAGMRHVRVDSPSIEDGPNYSTTDLDYLTPEQMTVRRNEVSGGRAYYTFVANQIQIYPIADTGRSLEMLYYQKVPNLTALFDSNWLSESHPDIYVAGVVAEIEVFVKNYDVAAGWHERMSIAISELETSDVQERWSGSSLTVKVG